MAQTEKSHTPVSGFIDSWTDLKENSLYYLITQTTTNSQYIHSIHI